MNNKTLFATCLVASLLGINIGLSQPIGTAFTYQGRLTVGTNTAPNGLYDFSFSLYSAVTGGTQIGSVQNLSAVPISNGLFMVTLDFGGVWSGNARWLAISVKTNQANSFTVLTPYQPLNPVPYALYAPNAGNASSATSANIAYGVATNTVTTADIASGQVVKSLNNLYDAVTLAAGTNVMLTPNGQTITIATPTDWHLAGNCGTTPGTNFLGTTDNQPLELWVNNQRALRLEPNFEGPPNVIGGASNNVANSDELHVVVSGATIGGGAANIASGYFDTISGGAGNTLDESTEAAVIAGGYGNFMASEAGPFTLLSTIAGGGTNVIVYAEGSAIGGGENNFIDTCDNATIGGGFGNRIGNYDLFGMYSAESGTIAGGEGNTVLQPGGTIGGGVANVISNAMSLGELKFDGGTIGGGVSNQVNATDATIGGGSLNRITTNSNYATISGGNSNVVVGQCGSIAGGANNVATNYAFAAGNRAKACALGSFVWADATALDYNPDLFPQPGGIANSFNVRAVGGVYLVTAVNTTSGQPTAGMYVSAGGSGWNHYSDRNAKMNFSDVDGRDVLERLMRIPVKGWNYKTQDASVRHLGPMAQDFNAAFGTGESDKAGEKKYINSVDADGVALAAIQGLNQKVESENALLRASLRDRDAEIEALRNDVLQLKHSMERLTHEAK